MTTRKTFAQLMNEAFVTEDSAATTATTAEAPPLTLKDILDAQEKFLPILRYMVHDSVPPDGFYKFNYPPSYTVRHFDCFLLVHPTMFNEMVSVLSASIRLVEMTDEHWRSAAMSEMSRMRVVSQADDVAPCE